MIAFPQKYPEWLVLEVGADKPGDIKSIAAWLKPDVVVLTRFPDVPVHIEFFESKEHVIEEKNQLGSGS
jgi:UDP-N-acetylmuramoyl-tripeptide--D-alanyl-D-alanine ligase